MNKKEIRWGILGCGNIAAKFAEALKVVPGAERYAAAARDLERAQTFADRFGFEKAYGSYSELVSDPELDIVYVATPHSYHFLHTRLCLEHGKHVLCEKPFTVNTDQLDVLTRLAGEKGLFLMEALWTRFLPHIIKTRELIEEGIIGEVVSMDADFGMRFDFDLSFRLFNPLLAGGVLLDIGIYPLFLSLFLFGEPTILKSHSRLADNGVDLVTSIIAESESGVISHLNSTSIANTAIEATIFGTRGKIKMNRLWFTPVELQVMVEGSKKQVLKFPVKANGYEYEAIECIRCLHEGRTESDVLSLAFSRKLMKIMDQIREENHIAYPPEIESVRQPYGLDEI